MSISPALRRQASIALQLSVIALIIGSLGWQLLQLTQLTHASTTPEQLTRSSQLNQPAATSAALAQLFGQPSRAAAPAPAMTAVRLLACFVGSQSGQSSALLSIDGQPARRVRIGEQLAPGVQVTWIQPQSIEVTRNGQPYTLRLSRNEHVSQSVAAVFNGATQPLPY
ncbi:MAG: type II secretion system protein N [Pseudomonas sp.]|nr:type II secretion system protein N [Pseudomonas sp.]